MNKRVWALVALMCGMLAAPALAEEQTVTTRVLAEGRPSETLLYIHDSGVEGNALLFVAGTHGNEDGGYRAAEQMFQTLEVRKGRLLIVPYANAQAVQAYTRTAPDGTDMNRSYPGDPEGNDIQALAAEIIALVGEFGPVAVVDMHEGRNLYGIDGSIGNSLVVGLTADAFSIALDVLEAVNAQNGELRPFTFDTNAPMGSLNHTASALLGVDAYTIETPQIYDLEVRVRQQLLFVRAFLDAYGVEADW